MKYTTEVTINAPVKKAWEWFMDSKNIAVWQPTFESMEVLEGTPGHAGNKNKMIFTRGKGTMEMMEMIEEVKSYEYLKAVYTADGVHNINEMIFSEVDKNTTKIEMVSEFKFSGMMVVMGFLMQGLFKKESQNSLNLLKNGIEGE